MTNLNALLLMSTVKRAVVTYVGSSKNTSDLTTYTFSGHALGAAAHDRVVVVAVAGQSAGTPDVSSVTIAGISASEVASTGPFGSFCAIWGARVPTGTSGDIVVGLTAAAARCQINVYRKVGSNGLVGPADTVVDTTSPWSGSLKIPYGGCAVGVAGGSLASMGNTTWVGLSEDADSNIESSADRGASASLNVQAPNPGLTVSVSWAGGTPATAALVAASWPGSS